MKVLLVAINSKYIHSNLAVRYIKDYCKDFDVSILETNINTPYLNVVDEIVLASPDIIGFSTYIFNIDFVKKVIGDLRKITNAKIVLGGPEASGDLEYASICDHLIVGEGEIAWHEFLSSPLSAEKIIYGKPLSPKDWISPNKDYLIACKNKIVYYESSRGCPFSCSYCVSGNSAYRKKELSQVKKDIDFFCENNLNQVKFIDRTFNADLKRAKEIFSYIIGKNTDTNFHMEMAPDLFDDELFAILATAKVGQFQFEIGIQTFCESTLAIINRKMSVRNAEQNISKAIALGNIHIHIDLIFGLPNETLGTIEENINKAVSLNPHVLQLGFLKVLGSASLKSQCEEFNIVYSHNPPYEILHSSALSTLELIKLRQLEKVFDYFYNDKKFVTSINLLSSAFPSYYSLFEALGVFAHSANLLSAPIGLTGKASLLYDFAISLLNKGALLAPSEKITLNSVDKEASLAPSEKTTLNPVDKATAEEIIENCVRFDYLKLCSDPSLKKPLSPKYPIKGKYNTQTFIINPVTLSLSPTTITFNYQFKNPITQTYPHSIS